MVAGVRLSTVEPGVVFRVLLVATALIPRASGSVLHIPTAAPPLLGASFEETAAALGGTGRAKQVWAALRRGEDPLVSTEYPLGSKARFALRSSFASPQYEVRSRTVAACGTVKLLLGLPASGRRDRGPRGEEDDEVEAVLIPDRGGRYSTLCVSSQVGCRQACSFCLTGTMGLRRNLEAHEILLQLHAALGAAAAARMAPVRNVVFMGMGEPADNLASVEAALRAMTHPFGFALAPAHICVSSVGPSPERIKALRGLPARLAWSVHAADDSLRKALVPTTAHPITALRDAWADALTGAASRGLMVEVTLIDGVNDGEEEASRLAELLRPLPGKTRVNLIPYNANAGLGAAGELFRPSTEEAVRRFQRRLLDEHGLICTRRVARGADESAACGQLATRERVARRRVGSGAHGGAGENRRA